MVDFNALMMEDFINEVIDPLEIFEELPKSSEISNLYHVQAEILKDWYSRLRSESDIVVELNTGGGKTLVGLLMALSTMRELGSGVLYLVENNQLVDQVVAQAMSIGIPAKQYSGRGSVDADFANGKTILVGSYQSLFNGNSVFGVRGARKKEKIGGVIIDDAHASLEAIRDVFSFSIPAEGSAGLYRRVLTSFKGAFDFLDRPSTYQEFQEGIGDEVIGIPYLHWHGLIDRISSWVTDCMQDQSGLCVDMKNSLTFNWPLIKDNLKYCQVVISRTAITISALYPLLHMLPSFCDAQRRIYMSATITDYGDMVRAYNLRGLSSKTIIAPKTSAGIGRRMILSIPHDYLQNEEFVGAILDELNLGHGIVRLTSRSANHHEWKGINFFDLVGHEKVLWGVNQLMQGAARQAYSFINRYNGIDLPNDACRVLILEDLPLGGSDLDVITEKYLSDSNIISQRIAQRIEQGAGRGVRGGSDHCVVLLVGQQLTDWIKRKRNREFFSEAFRAQLEISDMISSELKCVADYREIMNQDFASDEGWKMFHSGKLAQLISGGEKEVSKDSFDVACAERKAFAHWIEHNNGAACKELLSKAQELTGDQQYKGWLLYLASCIAYDGDDKEYAANLNREAHNVNGALPNASSLTKAQASVSSQAQSISELANKYTSSRALIDRFDQDVSMLTFDAQHKPFEEALKMLGHYLGFKSCRKDDHGEGPDVYWASDDNVIFVIEAKNEKQSESAFHKGEAGQLRTACAWAQVNYPDYEVIPVSVHPNTKADPEASASDLFVLDPIQLRELKNRVRDILSAAMGYLPLERADRLSEILEKEGLTAQGIRTNYLARFAVD